MEVLRAAGVLTIIRQWQLNFLGHVIIGVVIYGALGHVPPSTSNCLIFQVTSEPHKLWYSTLKYPVKLLCQFRAPSHQVLATPLHVMRRHGLENLTGTGKVEGRTARGRQRLKYLDSLST